MVFDGMNGVTASLKQANSVIDDNSIRVHNTVLITNGSSSVLTVKSTPLLSKFIESHRELEKYKNGQPVKVDGQTLSIAGVAAAARYNAAVELDDSAELKEKVEKSRKVITTKVENGTSVYGLSTGFGGSADTRTDKPILLGHALLQHQHVGVLPTTNQPLSVLPLLDPIASTSMPEAWVRGAILIRMNSLIRGHSGVRWELIEKMNDLLRANITPVVPLRGSISASGDLSPLSYIAGTLAGNPSIKAFIGSSAIGARKILSSREALSLHGLSPLSLESKEQLGITNGTAVSASVAALALNEAVHMALLTQVCTAMGVEALSGTVGSFSQFIHDVARPHSGQIEAAQVIRGLLQGSKIATLHEEEVNLRDDQYSLRQDRYPLRTSPQFLGPQLEDLLSALAAVTQECNSTTDNPLIDSETGMMHHGGNFQAMAVTNAMEKTRLALHHLGKLMFSQSTELCNPAMNNGLPPSLAATDPSLNYHGKGVDIATAAYVAELGYLATPVSTHIQSAEMHNQAVNSLALISARATINSLEVLSMLLASYLYLLCQALDLRAMHNEFLSGFKKIVTEELAQVSGLFLSQEEQGTLFQLVFKAMEHTLDKTTSMDNRDRMNATSSCSTNIIVDFFCHLGRTDAPGPSMQTIVSFRRTVADRATELLDQLRNCFLNGEHGSAPAVSYLGKTKAVYQFVRSTLGVKMQGKENLDGFPNAIGVDEVTIGENISIIHEAIRDGKIQSIVVSLFE